MNKIKNIFSIKDLENLSGIKAHTIRIWEKRYQIFNPERTSNNFRTYSTDELLKLLNISFLNSYGYKISKISKYSQEELHDLVQRIYNDKTDKHIAINDFKLAMLTFDTEMFHNAFNKLLENHTFEEIFYKVFMALLDEIGLLWQTHTIKPAHEHFVSYLIIQKLIKAIEDEKEKVKVVHDTNFILFLPEDEIHELGLLFINYKLVKLGYPTVYLGSSVPYEDLLDTVDLLDNLIFVSYFTVCPESDALQKYLERFDTEILQKYNSRLLVTGFKAREITSTIRITACDSVASLIQEI